MKTTKKIFAKWAGVFVAALFVLSAAPGSVIENVNAESSYVDVQTSRWTGTEMVTTNESWLQDNLDGFEDDIEDAVNSSANLTACAEQLLTVYKQYEFIPQNKTLDDLEIFMEDLYNQDEELIEESLDIYGSESGEYHYLCHIHGKVFYSFYCSRIPISFTYINAPNHGGWLRWFSWDEDEGGYEYDLDDYTWTAVIYLGVWFLPVRNGWNALPKRFIGYTLELYFDIP